MGEPAAADQHAADGPGRRSLAQRMLDAVEKAGNRAPHPAVLFLWLILLVVALSVVLSWTGLHATYESAAPGPVVGRPDYPGVTTQPSLVFPPAALHGPPVHIVLQTVHVRNLLGADGIRFLFTSAVDNVNNFGVVGVILVAMVGIGLADEAGLIAALVRRLVAVAPRAALTFTVVLLGALSSAVSDIGFLVLVPLGAVAFQSAGRHPLAGLAAAFAGVGAGFGLNAVTTPADGIVTEITNEAIHLVDPGRSIGLTADLYFSIAATLLLAVVVTVVSERLVEPGLGSWTGATGVEHAQAEHAQASGGGPQAEAQGLRLAFYGAAAVVVVVAFLTFLPGAPLRNPDTGRFFDQSPFMDGLIFIVMLLFLVAGLCYGRGAGTLRGSAAVMAAVTRTFAGLGGLIFLLLVLAQLIACFSYTNIATIAAVHLSDALGRADVSALWLLLALVAVTLLLDVVIPGAIPKWAVFAPIFVPLFLRLGVAPQTVLAAYRVGDGPVDLITPLMVYLPFVVLLAQRYRKDAGVGTVVSLMLPYTLVVAAAWMALFTVWYLIGIPLGPGAPVHVPRLG
ncbi:AbgT family transporter [Streptacidiphilus sp. PB12-B1b]|uniref:AbgT family transporter n=1 Tax=Streptacidiphilus sp. PB12-B1b TaxID=2705012 RepID=UPI0015F9183F|nr:AbgT family transporter [Streptacidiphilus sp. PB12-B1b]QMU75989.1 AbgT family transporter [Streptacidiphilus sp. PB12-B1b]